MGSGSRSGLMYGIGAVLCVAVAVVVVVRLVPQAGVGAVDPASAGLALVSLAAALVSARQSVRALRSTPPVADEVAARLAIEVMRREGRARTQLLGGHSRTIDVAFDFSSASAHNTQHAQPMGRLSDIVAYYQALHPQRLVITGAPGAGKTVLALELALGLLAAREPGDAVPVRVSAAAWDAERPLRGWLVEHLVEAYVLPQPSAEVLVDAGLILPVIDGLDEMDADETPGYGSRAARAVRALNVYQHGREVAPLVLTCRSGQYQALEDVQVWTHDAARVEIRPVDSTKAEQFIRARVDDVTRWQPVLNTIANHPGATLAVGLSTPWRLTLATTVYEQRNSKTGTYLREPVALTKLGATSPMAVRDHLLEHFIPAAIAAHMAAAEHSEQHYSEQRVHQWLGVLASYLDHNAKTGRILGGVPLSGTDLILHQLWPLAGVNRVRITVLAAVALISLIATSILLAQFGIGFSGLQMFGACLAAIAIVHPAYMSWSELWPSPTYFTTHKLHTRRGRRQLARAIGFGLVIGLVIGLVMGLVRGLVFGLVLGLAVVFVGVLVGALVSGLVAGLVAGLVHGLVGDGATPMDPRDIVKRDLAFGLGLGLVLALVLGLVFALAGGLVVGSGFMVALVLVVGLMASIWFGLAGIRYVAFLLCTRRYFTTDPLPWRLGQFLNWCYQAGLIRQAGISYQFRHRELQQYLARSQQLPAPPIAH
jgi:MFS family permease